MTHDSKIDWLEVNGVLVLKATNLMIVHVRTVSLQLNETGRKLLFKDKKLHVSNFKQKLVCELLLPIILYVAAHI